VTLLFFLIVALNVLGVGAIVSFAYFYQGNAASSIALVSSIVALLATTITPLVAVAIRQLNKKLDELHVMVNDQQSKLNTVVEQALIRAATLQGAADERDKADQKAAPL